MNILKILTLNKHGDFEEVLFSSLLSYLLNPQSDHGLGQRVLKKLVALILPDANEYELSRAVVRSEYRLGDKGSVDILIEGIGTKKVAIEVKIWDRAARNISEISGEQVKRYCSYLADQFHQDDWSFIFLIPTLDSRVCVSQFKELCSDSRFSRNVWLMAWNHPSGVNEGEIANREHIIQQSVWEIIVEILREVNRVNIPLNTLWLLDSLYDIVPELMDSIPDRGRFPVNSDLEGRNNWHLFKTLFSTNKRWPSSLHTTVGIPYEWGDNRASLHGNSLYRIRTVTAYYNSKNQKEEYIPNDRVGIEMWPDVYAKSHDGIAHWLRTLGLTEKALSFNDKHLDSEGKEDIVLLTISKDVPLSEDNVIALNTILREGFTKIMGD
ncbi:PD-(D/E)XK nuclease family protein [Chloroflexota bacterium]